MLRKLSFPFLLFFLMLSSSAIGQGGGGLTVTATVTSDVLCPGDSTGGACAQAVGGAMPYEYVWDDLDSLDSDTIEGQCIVGVPAGTYYVTVTDAVNDTARDTVTITEPDTISIFTSSAATSGCGSCDGKAIVDSINGGTSPYTISWDDPNNQTGDTASSLCPGTYTATVTDGSGCEDSVDVTVAGGGVNNVSVSVSTTPDTCNEGVGSATANPSGGDTPYDYQWDDPDNQTTQTADSLVSSTYTVIVTDSNGCSDTATATVGNIGVTASIIDSSNVTGCYGDSTGSATADVSGGASPYSYQWDDPNMQSTPTADSLPAGTWSVQVTDANGCADSASVTIENPDSLIAGIDSTDDASCNGVCDGLATATVSGGSTPYSYQWDDPDMQTGKTADSLCAGTYTVTVTDSSGCTDTASATINEPAAIQLDISTTDSDCDTPTGSATVGVLNPINPPYSFQWDDPDSQQTATADSLAPGTYKVVVTDGNGCQDSAFATINTVGGPTASIIDSSNVTCYGADDGSATADGTGGNPPYDYRWDDPDSTQTATVDSLAPGTYTVTVTDQDGCEAYADVTIEEADSIEIAIDSVQDVLCSGDSTGAIFASTQGGNPPYTWQWDDPLAQTTEDADSLPAGTWTVLVSDTNNCTDSASATVDQNSDLTASISSSSDVSCNGGSDGSATATASGGTSPYSYQWDDPNMQTTATADSLPAGTWTVVVTDSNGCMDSTSVTISEPAPLDVTITDTTDVSCNGGSDGSATASASGGTSPYSYQWDDPNNQTGQTASNLSAGTYTVTVTDANGCVDSTDVTIDEPPQLSVSISKTDASCNGSCDGTGTANPSGGTSPYSYQWDDPKLQTTQTADSLCAGTYSVTVTDAKGCQTSASVTISEPAGMSLSVSTKDATCDSNDGEASASVTGGVSPYDYQWNDSLMQTTATADSLSAGTYKVVVTDDNGCQDSISASVSDSSSLTATIDSSLNVDCNGDSSGYAEVSVSGGSTPYSYQWDDPDSSTAAFADNLPAGTWSVLVTDSNGCSASDNVSISEPKELLAGIGNKTEPSCATVCDGEAEASVSGGTSPYSYQWDDPNMQSSQTATKLCEGTFNLEVTDDNGCIDSATVVLDAPDTLEVSTSVTDASCAGACDGEATANPSGGTSPYDYQWDDPNMQTSQTATNLCEGTYTVTVTDANGCQTSATVTVGAPSAVSLSTSTTDATCGNNDGSASVSVSGGTTPYAYQWDDPNMQTSPTADSLAAGGYTVTVTDSNGCTASASVTLNDIGGPSVSISDSSQIDCNGDSTGSATASVSGGTAPYSYQWDDPNMQTSAKADSLPAGTWTVTVTDSNGCTGTEDVVIEEPPALSISISDQENVSCNGGSDGYATVSVSGGISPYSYQWDDPDMQTTPTADSLAAGTYMLTVTDANGCSEQLSVTITEPNPLSVSTSATSPGCANSCDGEATASVSGGTTPYSYQWDDPNFQTSQTATGLCPGTYTVEVTDANGCVAYDTVTVDSTSNPLQVSTSTTDATCGSSDGSATANVSGGTGPYSYQWDDPSNQTTQTATGLSSGSYTVIVTDANGCSESAIANVDDVGGPDIAITDSSDVSCNGGSDGTATVSVNSGTAPYSFKWDDPYTQTDSIATALSAGTYSVVVTDGNGCKTATDVTIEEPAALSINASVVSDASCAGSCDGIAHADVNGGTMPYGYQWDDPNFQSNDTATGLCSGGYQVTVTDSNGCSITDNVTIDEPLPLQASGSSSPAICGQANGSASISVSGGQTPYSYDWSNGGSGATQNALTPGTYSVLVSDANGCSDSVQVTVGDTLDPTLTLDSIAPVSCNGEGDGYIRVDASGGQAPYSYQWNDPDSSTNAYADSLDGGVYTVKMKDANGCKETYTDTVGEPAALSAQVNAYGESCKGSGDGSIALGLSGGTPSYQIDWSNGMSGDSISGLDQGVYSADITDAAGCKASVDSVELGILSTLEVATKSKPETCDGGNGSAKAEVSGGVFPISYQWDDPQAQKGAEAKELKAGAYTVTVQDDKGCTVRDTVQVADKTNKECLDIPTVFTPNGDGVNDTWHISGLEAYKSFSLEVFNRWGSLVYKNNEPGREWDGTRNGSKMPEAAYYYIITLNDGERKMQGEVSIVR